MAFKPLISIIMPVYNGERYIFNSISSVLNQTYQNFQLIIINDGSTDSTENIILSFKDPRIEYYKLETNHHIAYVTNYAFQKVNGTYVALIDSDDMWSPQKLEKQYQWLIDHPKYMAVFTWVNLIDEKGAIINDDSKPIIELYQASTENQEYWLRFFFFYGNRLNNPSVLMHTKALNEVGPHNLFYIQAEDFEWWVRFTKKYCFGIIEEPLTYYRRPIGDTNSISSSTELHDTRFFNEYMMIRQHFFDDMPDELFIRTFQCSFRNPNAHTPIELECEKAFLLCNPMNHSSAYSAIGVEKLEQLFNDPETAQILYDTYNFSTIECGKYTQGHLYYDPITQDKCNCTESLKQCIYIAQLHIGKLDEQIRIQNNEILSYREKITSMDTTICQLEDTIETLNNTLNKLTNSHIWKISAPLRKIADYLKK